ncbi:MAG: hypothetical protein JRJ12_15300 [Deltaproteobacteria bacterium]|nr:hypothetical protein [Deltaproteobacteria bacterium]
MTQKPENPCRLKKRIVANQSTRHGGWWLSWRQSLRSRKIRLQSWLWKCFYPLHVWSRVVCCCSWFLKQYDSLLWQPLLRRWLQQDDKNDPGKGMTERSYVCCQCGRTQFLALVVQLADRTEFFCSAQCNKDYMQSLVCDSNPKPSKDLPVKEDHLQ